MFNKLPILLLLPLGIFFTACGNENTPADSDATETEENTSGNMPGVEVRTDTAFVNKATDAMITVNKLATYIDSLAQDLFERAGGPLEEDPTRPKEYQNVEIAQKFIFQDRKGYELEEKVIQTRNHLLSLVDNDPNVAASLYLNSSYNPASLGPDEDWVKKTFENKPVALALSRMINLKVNAQASSRQVVEHLK